MSREGYILTSTVRFHGTLKHEFKIGLGDSTVAADSTTHTTTGVAQCETDDAGADLPSKDPFAYTYTGRHDHGDLPKLRSDGPLGALVNAIHSAKADSERFFKPVVAGEKAKVEAKGVAGRKDRTLGTDGPGKRKGTASKGEVKEQKRQKV